MVRASSSVFARAEDVDEGVTIPMMVVEEKK